MTPVASLDLRHAADGRLARAIAGGSEEALDEAHHRHAGAMRAVARQAVANKELAEEAVQDVFFSLWVRPERFDPRRGTLRTWLQLQAQRRAIDMARSEGARRRREQHHSRRERRPLDDVERHVLASDSAGRVRRALSRLHPRERQALELAYLEGHSYRQVAALLGQPEGTIKNRIRAGLRRLRALLTPA